MNEKINSNIGKSYTITSPSKSSSSIVGGISRINTSATKQLNNKLRSFSSTIDEMDLTLSTNKNEVENINTSSITYTSEEWLEIQREAINSTISDFEKERNELETKCEAFFKVNENANAEDISKLSTGVNFAFQDMAIYDSTIYQQNVEEIINISNEQYLAEHLEEFESYMGMTLEEYNQKIDELNGYISYLEAYDYTLRQEAKQLPYLQLTETEEYQNYLANLTVEDKTPRMLTQGIQPYDIDTEYINGQLSTSINISSSSKNMIDQEYLKYVTNLEYLTEDQIIIYNYIFDTQGENAAIKYLDAIEDSINQAKAMEEATIFISKITDEEGNIDVGYIEAFMTTSGQGLGNGVETFFEGYENLFDFKGEAVKTDNQYAQMFILQELAKLQDDEKMEIIDFLDDTYQISTSIGNMLPSITISTIANIVAPGSGEVVGNTLMGISAAGNARNDALVNGANQFQALLYGLGSGASEAVVGKLMGNIPGLNEGAKFAVKDILSEGVEEFYQTYVDAGLKAVIYQEVPDITNLSQEALQAFVYGCITSGIMTGGQVAINFTINGKKYNYNLIDFIKAFNNGEFNGSNNSNANDETANISDKIGRYNELMKIVNTDAYINWYYDEYGAKELTNFNPDTSSEFYHIKQELESLNAELIQLANNGVITRGERLSNNWGYASYSLLESVDINTVNQIINDSKNSINNVIKDLVQQQGINATMKGLWHYVYGNDLSYIPEQFRTVVQQFSVETVEDLLTYEQIKSIADSDIAIINQNAKINDVQKDEIYENGTAQSTESIKNKIGTLNYNKTKVLEYVKNYLASNVRKFFYKDTSEFIGLNEQIIQNGLYHFTNAADAIINSGYIKASNATVSYASPISPTVKSFFFNGVPEVGAIATNLDYIPVKATAVKVKATVELVNNPKLKLRYIDDMAITYDGKFDLTGYEVEKCFFGLDIEDGKLVYKQITEETYNTYENTETGKVLQEYVSNKHNVTDIKGDFLTKIFGKFEFGKSYDDRIAINDTFDDLKEMNFNASYDSNDLDATAEMIPIGKLIDIIRDTSKFNEFIQKNDSRIIDINYYVAFVQFVNVIKENNYDMRFNQLEQQRLEKIYNEALAKLPINKIQYSVALPNDIKLKLMIRDNIVYDRDLLLSEVRNKIDNADYFSNPYFIFDDLFLFYYREVSETLTIEEQILGDNYSFNTCADIYLSCLRKIIEQNIYLDETNFKKLAGSIGENIKYSVVQEFLNNYLNLYPDVYLDTSKLDYSDSLPSKIKEAVVVNILEKNDWFLSDNGGDFYGVDQGVLKKHMEFRIKNLAWLTSETDFLTYLQNVREYSLTDANKLLNKYKSFDFSNYIFYLSGHDYHVITEYIYDKCYRENRFDVMDIIERSFGIKYINENEVVRLCNKLINQGMTESEALRTICALDSTGVCSYASVANAIVLAYKDNIQKFEEDFGYPLYVYDNGRLELNAGELLLDMYTYINSNKCGGTMFSISETGELHVNNLVTNNQIYLSGFTWHNTEGINAFLKSKNSDLGYKLDYYYSRFFKEGTATLEDIKQIKETIINHLNKNGSVGLGIYHTNEHQFRLIGKDETVTTNNWSEGGGHAVCITGVLDDSFIVSSWGKRYRIPFSDFINNKFNVIFRSVEGIK